jgi:hypothetical protein
MRFRSLKLVTVLLFLLACGCAWSKKPYADSPLVLGRRAVIANPINCPPPEKWERPMPPPPP